MDVLLYWNAVALEANRQDHSKDAGEQGGPVMSARALALVHLAIYDAYFSIAGGNPSYSGIVAPVGLAVNIALGAAAHDALTALYPSQQPLFDERLANYGAQFGVDVSPMTPSFKYGKAVALTVLRMRATDITGNSAYIPNNQPGSHRVDPANPTQGFYGAAFGANRPFATSINTHQILPYPLLGSAGYNTALHQVLQKGGAPGQAGLTRTATETMQGIFWAYDGANQIGTPPRLYNQIIAQIAIKKKKSVAQNVELFARINVAMADAGIFAWREKYRYELWRPVLGIREHDLFCGPNPNKPGGNTLAANSNPFWLPLGAPKTNTNKPSFTPNFPSYPSGHATFGAAAFQTARFFFGVSVADKRLPDTITFDFISDELNGKSTDSSGVVRTEFNHHFPSLWDAIHENALSRVFLGVHWEFDAFAPSDPTYSTNIGGVRLGLAIAEDIQAGGPLKPF